MSTTEDTRVVSARLPRQLADELEALAERHTRNLSQELLIAVKRHLKIHRKRSEGLG
jgi:hypothetical protein